MSDLVGNPEDRFSHNEAQILFKPRKAIFAYANSKGADQPMPERRLISSFFVHHLESIISRISSFGGITE